MASIPEIQRQAAEDLIFDRRSETCDPLKNYLALFEREESQSSKELEALLPAHERLRRDILSGDQGLAARHAEAALETLEPLKVLNDVLLPAMKEVGDAFGAGELQLPFVLQSAEAMKAAVRVLEPHMAKREHRAKGRILLATVKGDVHDIGKNLVNVVLSNNGFEVEDLGIKQPIEAILAALETRPADAVGLSGLLVKSVQTMKENLVHMADRGLQIPVILGGAALTRNFVERECRPVYPGPVLYAADAFEGLSHMNAVVSGTLAESGIPRVPGRPKITVRHPGEPALELDTHGQSPWVHRDIPSPQPPFLGVRDLQPSLAEIYAFLDDFATLRHRWSFTQGRLSDEAFAEVITEKAVPLLKEWKARLLTESALRPRARYGYFPCASEGNRLKVFAPEDTELLAEIPFPRQTFGRRLCVADFFQCNGNSRRDVLPLQLVTMGAEAMNQAAELYASDRYVDYFLFHGLVTELTEAFAELVHARIRSELGIHDRDANVKPMLLDQGYQGSRFSFGYPACPALEGNGVILDLLQGASLGVTLSESCQMVPEYTTSALIAWHPQARYFAV
jgi:5-methyltetrahydrofolate--homocysteine methyltransferase